MVVVRYYENNKELLNQLCTRVPKKGTEVVVKGRKGVIVNVHQSEKEVRADVKLEVIRKVPVGAGVDNKKKKK